jgi:hypothetical protein
MTASSNLEVKRAVDPILLSAENRSQVLCHGSESTSGDTKLQKSKIRNNCVNNHCADDKNPCACKNMVRFSGKYREQEILKYLD